MTPEQIIDLARGVVSLSYPAEEADLLAFAQLVRNAALEEASKTLEGYEFIQDGITYRETKHAGSWQVKSTLGLFVTANTKKIRSLKS